MFKIEFSKLYSEIMEGFVKFFGLDASATETEIHDALQGKTLTERINEAVEAHTGKNTSDIEELRTQLDELRTSNAAILESLNAKTQEVETLQGELSAIQEKATASETTIATMKAEHQKQVDVLSGQLAAMKAGKAVDETAPGESLHLPKADGQPKVITMQSDALRNLVTPKKTN